MKKLLPFIIVVVLAAAGLGVWQFTKKDKLASSSNPATATNQIQSGDEFKGVDACTVLTQDVATQILGADNKKGDTSAGNVSTDALSVSNCTYSTNYTVGQPISSVKAVSILVRAAKNSTGKDSNNNSFGPGRPAGAQTVSGYGDDAFWNPTYGQLNILKHNNWYILSSGSSSLTTRTLDDAKKLADLLIDKL